MSERLSVFLGQEWAGLAIAAIVTALGLVPAVAVGGSWYLATVPGLVLFAGAVKGRLDGADTPPPGRLHVVEGRRMHLLAEGEARSTLPVIWVSGGHGEGLIMHHLHKEICGKTRSILFDRTGSGWSAPADGPVTLGGEARRLALLRDAAGEEGPFVLAGHSFGGLFAVTFAHRYPRHVAGLILLDSTPQWNIAFAGHLTFPPLIRKAWRGALASHFGMGRWVEPEIDDDESDLARQLGDVAEVINRHSVRPKSLLAEASVFRSAMKNPFDLAIGEGALGETPLVLMTPEMSSEERASLREVVGDTLDLDDRQTDNFMDGLRQSAAQQTALSTRGSHVKLPEHTSHMFPYEVPDRVLAEVRAMIATV